MVNSITIGVFLLLQLVSSVYGEIFGRRRQTGSRRRSGLRPVTNVKYGLSMTVWYVIIGVGVAFVIALIAAIVYYCLVVRKRDKKMKESKYRPIGGGYDARSKAEKNKEMEAYLAKVKVQPMSPSYRDFETNEYRT